jgi:transcriptional regulator with XRE-family HTH domain
MKKVKAFGQFLKNAREKAGVTQLEVSNALGYSAAQFVSNWERGLSYPPMKAVIPLAKLYKIKPDILVEWIIDVSVEQTLESLKREYKRLKKG